MLRHCSIALAVAGCSVLVTPRAAAPTSQAASPLRIRPATERTEVELASGADVFRYRYNKGPKRA